MGAGKKTSKKQRIETAKTLAEKISRAKTLVFCDYRGLTVNQFNDLRNKVVKAGGELAVTKNTLLKRAIVANDFPLAEEILVGPTATLFAYEDEVSPIKEVALSAKTFGIPTFKAGYFGQTILSASAVERLSQIPTRDVLLAQVLGSVASPLYGTVSVLSANLRNLVSVLDQVSRKGVNN